MHNIYLLIASLADPAAGGAGAAPAGGQAAGGGGAAACGGGSPLSSILFMVAMFAVFWFILIRPQQKRAKEHAAMLNGLKKGDSVITRGGVIGRVTGVQDNVVTMEVQEKVRIRVVKSFVEGLHAGDTQPAKDSAKSAAAAASDAKT